MPPKLRRPQSKKEKKQTSSPKATPVKRKRKSRKSKQSPSVTQEENEDIEDNYLREMLPSIVLAEDPCYVKQTTMPVRMDICEFWQFLFSGHWEGRVRVCEGFLMTKLQETFDHLVKKKEFTKTQVVRDFDVPLSSFFKPDAGAAEIAAMRRRLVGNQAVKITFTYYGGNYREKAKQVRFHRHPNSVFTPRLRTLHSILKNPSDKISEACHPYEADRRLTDDKHGKSSPRWEVESNSPPLRRDFNPALPLSTNCSETPVTTKEDNYFKSKVPDNIEHQCVRAMKEFVVVKEHVIKSKIWMTRTEITFARKESRWQIFQNSVAMDAFYSSPLFLSSLSIIPHGKAGLDLTVV